MLTVENWWRKEPKSEDRNWGRTVRATRHRIEERLVVVALVLPARATAAAAAAAADDRAAAAIAIALLYKRVLSRNAAARLTI